MNGLLALPMFTSVTHDAAEFAAIAGSNLISAAWEGLVLTAGLSLCLRLFPRLSAAARSVVWVNAFLLLVTLQVLPYVGMHPAPGIAAQPAVFRLGLAWCYGLGCAWLAFSILRGTQLVLGAVRLHRMAHRAAAVLPNTDLQPSLCVRTAVGSIRRSAELCLSNEVERPSVFGFLHPRILVPPVLLERLTHEELQQVVLHEMEHLRRADDWMNLLQKVALVIFPLNPALFWVERRLCTERELACDDRVLSSASGRKAYAICLTHLAEYSMLRRSLSLALGAWERRPELVRRVHRILRRPSQGMSRTQTLVLSGGLTMAVVGGALLLGRSPQLVYFSKPEQLTTASNSMPSANGMSTQYFHRTATATSAAAVTGDGTTRAQMVKAVMTPTAEIDTKFRGTRNSAEAINSKTRLKNAFVRSNKASDVSRRRQGWVVLTRWTEASPTETGGSALGPETVARPHIVWAVSRDHVAPYAAIPTPNGWLLIQI